MYDKEKIYDKEIYPLMEQIINICKENDVQMLFSCYLRTDDEGELSCDTYLESEEQNCGKLQDAAKVITSGYLVQKPFFMATTITNK